MKSLDDEVVVAVKHLDICFRESHYASRVTEQTHAEEVVFKFMHDLTCVGPLWQMWEWKSGLSASCDAITIHNADNGWHTLSCEGFVGCLAVEVMVASARVCDGSGVCGVVE